jgi:hypothetical protein
VPSTHLAYSFLVGNPASLFYTPAANEARRAYRAKLRARVRAAPARTARAQKKVGSMRRFLVKQAQEPVGR